MINFILLLARFLTSAFFLLSAYFHLSNWKTALAKTAATGISHPEPVLVLATLALILGGLSLLLGYKLPLGVALLFIEILATAFLFHPFWTASQADTLPILLQFLQRTALAGALLLFLTTGAGKFSLDKG